MDSQKIVFRVDGSSAIGLGHISRCCALADILKSDFEIIFYTRSNTQLVIENIKQYSSAVFSLIDTISYDEEAIKWISVLKGDEIVVLDGYNFNTNYQQQIKDKGCKLVCIDDIHAYHFLADVVINHAPGIAKKDYSVEPYTQLYLGTEYVLLRKIFLDAAQRKPAVLHLESSPVLVCFGGADPNNFTKQTLVETMHLFPQREINVVVGAGYLHLQELKKTIWLNNLIKLHININAEEMLALMQQSHIAVTSASTIAFEYMCVKGNLFLKCTADNQKDLYASLIEKKCAFDYKLLRDKYSSNAIVNNQYNLIDGKSNLRLHKVFTSLTNKYFINELQFVRAKDEDADLLFEWINDTEVRAQSLSNNLIAYNEHANWFSKKLIDKNCYLYVAHKNNVPIGVVRFDVSGEDGSISYLVDKLQRGKGLGFLIISEGIKQFESDSHFTGYLKATVKSTNVASLKIFVNAGFKKESETTDVVHFKMLV